MVINLVEILKHHILYQNKLCTLFIIEIHEQILIPNNCVQIISVCQDRLGVENGDIGNGDIEASHAEKNWPGSDGRLNGERRWSADESSHVKPWIQADIRYHTSVSGVLIQGDGDSGNGDDWVTSFKVSTSLDSSSEQTFIKDVNGNEMVSHDVFYLAHYRTLMTALLHISVMRSLRYTPCRCLFCVYVFCLFVFVFSFALFVCLLCLFVLFLFCFTFKKLFCLALC